MKSPDFSLAFKQMASFVAIAKTKVETHVLDELIQQCYVIIPKEPLGTPAQISNAISVVFGLHLNVKDIALAFDRLKKDGRLLELPGGHVGLKPETAKVLNDRIEGARKLEAEVRKEWIAEVQGKSAHLDETKLWSVLQEYLSMAFRRHGILAVELLDPEVSIPQETNSSLSAALNKSISKQFDGSDAIAVRQAMESFFLSVGTNRKRAEYISSLADAAFNYYSLAVAPDVSAKLRGNLSQLVLFLDTNFLFGLLNLHVNSQVDVSAELVHSIRRFKLPFRLRYHEATVREVTNTLYYFQNSLKHRKWSQGISRAIVATGAMSGIELRYHVKNAEGAVAVEDFFAPYEHWRILLKDTGIDVYNVTSNDQQLQNRADLEADYKVYLKGERKEKPDEAVQHDMAVLETVRSNRSKARSTLEAGSLLVTCDYHLFKFDFDQSRKEHRPHSTVLPSLLWQILRPFVSDHGEFDKAFAETFALPEFSLSRGGAKKAAARMASILAGYSDIPEETAIKMLTNDALIAELQTKRTEKEFEDTIESALAKENAVLNEEKSALAAQVEADKKEKIAKDAQLIEAHGKITEKETELSKREEELAEKEATIKSIKGQVTEKDAHIVTAGGKIKEEADAKAKALQEADTLKATLATATAKAERHTKITAVVVGVLVVLLFELMLNYVTPCTWLNEHPNGYSLQAGISLMLFFGIVGTWVKSWRTWCWAIGFFGLLVAVLPMLGGPKQPPVE